MKTSTCCYHFLYNDMVVVVVDVCCCCYSLACPLSPQLPWLFSGWNSQAVQNAAYNLQELLPGSMQVHLDPKKMPWEATLYTKKYKIVWIYCFLDPPRGAKWMGRGARFNTTHWRVLVTGLNLIEFVYLMYVLHARIDAYIHACWWGSWIDAPHQFGNPTEDTTYTRKSRPNGMSSFPLSHSHRTCFNLTWYDWRMIKPYMLFCFFLIKHAKHTINTSNI